MPRKPIKTQKQGVYELLSAGPLRTEQIKIEAMKLGISCADTYLRMLQRDKKLCSYHVKKWDNDKQAYIEKDDTKTWCYTEYYENEIKPLIGQKYAA